MGRGPGLSASPDLSPRLEKYELIEEIGHGGMATVFRARDRRLGREVAVKIIHRHLRENREVAQRFESEARTVAKLKHPNIVEVYDVSDAGEDERYLVVELVRGSTLRQLLSEQSVLPPEVAAAIGIELADALDHAHQLGVIHRDVKPENVLVAESNVGTSAANPEREAVDIKITDFGIAKLLDAQGVTSTGQVLGSPAHMAPEQIEGGDVNARADVFGVGVLLYECMVGKLPFDGKNPAQVLRRVLDGTFTPADRARPVIGAGYSAVLARALAHKPADRYASAAELSQALRAELTAIGVEAPKRELHAYLADPQRYTEEHVPRIVALLSARARAARERRDFTLAAASYNRALAYRPDDPELLSQVSTLARGERLKVSAQRAFAALVGSLIIASGVALVARFGARPAQAPVASAPVRIALPPKPPVSVEPRLAAPTASAAVTPKPRKPALRPVGSRTPEELAGRNGIARVQILVDGPASASLRIDGVETPWFGRIQELTPGAHVFEFVPPNEQCCESGQTLEKVLRASESPDDVQIIRGRIEFRPAVLDLRGEPGSTASCGTLGEFPIPSIQQIPMAVAQRNVRCQLFPPPGSTEAPKQFDVTLSPGGLSTNLGQ